MGKSIHQKLHQQHNQWQSDYDAWLADKQEWTKELQHAMSELTQVEGALRDAGDALESHASTIWENQQRLTAHELVISQESKAGEDTTDSDWESIHDRHAREHEQISDAHERIKHYHHSVVAEVAKLIKKVREAL